MIVSTLNIVETDTLKKTYLADGKAYVWYKLWHKGHLFNSVDEMEMHLAVLRSNARINKVRDAESWVNMQIQREM